MTRGWHQHCGMALSGSVLSSKAIGLRLCWLVGVGICCSLVPAACSTSAATSPSSRASIVACCKSKSSSGKWICCVQTQRSSQYTHYNAVDRSHGCLPAADLLQSSSMAMQ